MKRTNIARPLFFLAITVLLSLFVSEARADVYVFTPCGNLVGKPPQWVPFCILADGSQQGPSGSPISWAAPTSFLLTIGTSVYCPPGKTCPPPPQSSYTYTAFQPASTITTGSLLELTGKVDIAQQGSSVTLSLVGYQNGNPFTGALGQAVDTIKPFTYTAALCPRGLAPCWLPVSVDPGYIITDGPGVNTTTFLDEQLTVSLVGQAKYQATDRSEERRVGKECRSRAR